MSMDFKIDGIKKTLDKGYVKIDGVLKQIDRICTKIDGVLKEIYSSMLGFYIGYLLGNKSYVNLTATHNGYNCIQLHAEGTDTGLPEAQSISDIKIDFTNATTLTVNLSFEGNNTYYGHIDILTSQEGSFESLIYQSSSPLSKRDINISVKSITGLHNLLLRVVKHNDGSNTVYKDLYVYEIKIDGASIWKA
jgi:hypothetical protein